MAANGTEQHATIGVGDQVVDAVTAYRDARPDATKKEAFAVVAAQLGSTPGAVAQAYYVRTRATTSAPPTDPPPDAARKRRKRSELLDLLARADAVADRLDRDLSAFRQVIGELQRVVLETESDLAAREEYVKRVEGIVARVAAQP